MLLKEINSKQVVKQAIQILDQTKKNLIVTHLLEDSGLPPKQYLKALSQALDRGVSVTRYLFGSEAVFEAQKHKFDSRVKHLVITDISSYQRMIVSDKQKLLFRLGKGSFGYSQNSQVLKAFLSYLENLGGDT